MLDAIVVQDVLQPLSDVVGRVSKKRLYRHLNALDYIPRVFAKMDLCGPR